MIYGKDARPLIAAIAVCITGVILALVSFGGAVLAFDGYIPVWWGTFSAVTGISGATALILGFIGLVTTYTDA